MLASAEISVIIVPTDTVHQASFIYFDNHLFHAKCYEKAFTLHLKTICVRSFSKHTLRTSTVAVFWLENKMRGVAWSD